MPINRHRKWSLTTGQQALYITVLGHWCEINTPTALLRSVNIPILLKLILI